MSATTTAAPSAANISAAARPTPDPAPVTMTVLSTKRITAIDYTKSMELSEYARSILSDTAFAHVAFVETDGTPHVTPVWIDINDDGRPWINTIVGRRKERRLPLGSSVAFSATAPGNGYLWVSIRGRVIERRLDGADADIDRLAEKYRGRGSKARTLPGEERISIVIEPEVEYGGPTR